MARAPKVKKYRARMMAMLAELVGHPDVVIDSLEVRRAEHSAAVKSRAKRAGVSLHPQVASLMAELPRFCVEWHAGEGRDQVRGAVSLLHELDRSAVLQAFGYTAESALAAVRDGALLDYGLSDDVSGVLLRREGDAIGPLLAFIDRKLVYSETELTVDAYLERLLVTRGARRYRDGDLAALFGDLAG
jgi:hypothetical protein